MARDTHEKPDRPEADADEYVSDRLRMVDRQLRARGITDAAVLEAMTCVPRHLFIPEARRHTAYEDSPVPIGHDQTISQPYIVAYMLQELQVDSSHRVLDVGCGSGYQTALLSGLAGHVYAVERIAALTEAADRVLRQLGARNVTLATRDGSDGWPEHAPFDRIICGAAAPDIPAPWIDQLADGGRIVAPVGGRWLQTIEVVDKRGDNVTRRRLIDVRFVSLIGAHGW